MSDIPTIKIELPTTGAGFRDFEGLTDEQRIVAEQQLQDAQMQDVYSALSTMSEAINTQGEIIGGFESDDIDISFSPTSKKTKISIAATEEVDDDTTSTGLPDPTALTANTGLYPRECTWDGSDATDPLGGTVVSIGTPDEDAMTVMAWVVDYQRLVEATEL